MSLVGEKKPQQTKPNEKHADSAVSDTATKAKSTEQTDSTLFPDTPEQTDSTATTDTEAPTAEATPSVDELTRQLAQAKQKAEIHWDNLLRKQADYDNLQKRMARELDNARKYALEKFATELLAVKDSMELGLDAAAKSETELGAVHEGMDLTLKMMTDTMAKFGINEINPIEEKFNPQWHEAMAMQPVPNAEDGTVLHVHQKGYQLNDRLLRPARVMVAKAVNAEKPLENQ
ncbi:MAG: nucleotide exchange factor GrpE [Candidatus Parabeggiatoa sp. nov. 2]|nr:MAG: nucleotide exchange factor GrpE [Beggiatoa sp. 4572_84]RKZ61039.1 MAG: nucleotide exchange factor GrpE [Gammaproteobacteria bacterium]